jgi:hypothetical protein
MNMQICYQVAEIDRKVKLLRSLLAQVETRQASLQRSLWQPQVLNGVPARQPIRPMLAPVRDNYPGEEYVDALMRRGRL